MKKRNFRRSLFFLTDRLQISRAERRLIILLLAILLIIQSVTALIPRKSSYNQEDYEAFLQEVRKKISEQEQREAKRMEEYAGLSSEKAVDSSEIRAGSAEYALSVSVNTAGPEELTRLPGIGPSYAERIVEYREKHGAFTKIEELLKIRGIGEKRLESIRPFVKL